MYTLSRSYVIQLKWLQLSVYAKGTVHETYIHVLNSDALGQSISCWWPSTGLELSWGGTQQSAGAPIIQFLWLHKHFRSWLHYIWRNWWWAGQMDEWTMEKFLVKTQELLCLKTTNNGATTKNYPLRGSSSSSSITIDSRSHGRTCTNCKIFIIFLP